MPVLTNPGRRSDEPAKAGNRRAWRAMAWSAAAALLWSLAGCRVDTKISTEVAADGSVSRKLDVQLRGVERNKESATYPAKRFVLPQAPAWTITEATKTTFKAQTKAASGQAVPSGYDRFVPILKRHAGSRVRVTVRDHFLARSFRYEERFRDTVRAAECKSTVLSEYDHFAKRLLKEAEKNFGVTHDSASLRRYLTRNLRKLVTGTVDVIERSGLWAGLIQATFRMALGGFPIKNKDQLLKMEPRTVLQALLRHCLMKLKRKPDRLLAIDAPALEALRKALANGTLDEQNEARKKILKMGPKVLHKLQQAAGQARAADPASGAAKRLDEVVQALREAQAARLEALVKKLAREIEARYLHPPPEQKARIEKTLAQMFGGHIEANFAPCEFLFLVRVKLPGELAEKDRDALSAPGGQLRWNFSALDFYLRDKVLSARSRIWNDKNVKRLGAALMKAGQELPPRTREEMEGALAQLDEAALVLVRKALQSCVETQGRAALETLAALAAHAASGKTAREAAACARRILAWTAPDKK